MVCCLILKDHSVAWIWLLLVPYLLSLGHRDELVIEKETVYPAPTEPEAR